MRRRSASSRRRPRSRGRWCSSAAPAADAQETTTSIPGVKRRSGRPEPREPEPVGAAARQVHDEAAHRRPRRSRRAPGAAIAIRIRAVERLAQRLRRRHRRTTTSAARSTYRTRSASRRSAPTSTATSRSRSVSRTPACDRRSASAIPACIRSRSPHQQAEPTFTFDPQAKAHQMIDINNFDAIEISLASSKQIRSWKLRRGYKARDHQLPHAQAGEGRPLLRAHLRSHQGLGVLLRQVQACPLQGHRMRALRRRGHALSWARPAWSPAASSACSRPVPCRRISRATASGST